MTEVGGQKSEVRGVEMTVRCAWCDREMGSKIVQGEYLKYLPAEERVTHGICDECMEREFVVRMDESLGA